MRDIVIEPTLEGWRSAARRLIAQGIDPGQIHWREVRGQSEPGLFEETAAPSSRASGFLVPRAFLELARFAARHSDPTRWSLLYSVLWRLSRGERDLLRRADDPEIAHLQRLEDEVRREAAAAGDSGAAPFVPTTEDLEELARAASSCRGCDLYRHATQTVFGTGPADARAMLVGEQPGDQEDRQGAPFVGPAGEVLDRALVEAGLDRGHVYVTNVVKHFKFVRTPRRRIHQTPGSAEIGACRPWLESELAILKPRVLVCLGATASKALLGPDFRITRDRGRFVESSWASRVLATYHPSAVLRAEDEAGQRRLYATLVGDLKLVAGALA